MVGISATGRNVYNKGGGGVVRYSKDYSEQNMVEVEWLYKESK